MSDSSPSASVSAAFPQTGIDFEDMAGSSDLGTKSGGFVDTRTLGGSLASAGGLLGSSTAGKKSTSKFDIPADTYKIPRAINFIALRESMLSEAPFIKVPLYYLSTGPILPFYNPHAKLTLILTLTLPFP